MSRRKRVLLVILALPLLALATANLVGFFLPREHTVASQAFYPQPPDSVWSAISDFANEAGWRPDLKRTERLEDRDGHPVWLEVGLTDQVPYEILVSEPPHRLVMQTADPDLPFRGRWRYRVDPAPGGSRLEIREWGELHGAMYRFLARFAFGYHSKVDGILRALGSRWGETTTPEHVPPGNE